MNRIKVISEVSELVPILRAVDTDVKRKVFVKLSADWATADQIHKEFGKDGVEAVQFFEKMKLVESRWQGDVPPKKAFHTYYTSFQVNATCPILEISDVLAAVTMPQKDFEKLEKKILAKVTEEGTYSGTLAEDLKMNQTFLKSLIRRSAKMEFRGQRVEKVKL